MHVDEVICHGENGWTGWETSHRGCIMRMVISKEVTAGGRCDIFLDSEDSMDWVVRFGNFKCCILHLRAVLSCSLNFVCSNT